MKATTSLSLFLFLLSNLAIAQNNSENPCITDAEYAELQKQISENIKNIPQNDYRGGAVTLQWPLKAAAALKDCDYYHIGAYVDHDVAVGSYKDFNCGTNSYDGHRGTDIATWPFNFYKMDNDLVEVVAAADGTILAVHDGEFDRNCTSNNLTANYIIIQHSDGSRALYWHMKKNSVTKKIVGQTVVAGEKLGVVGSSGSASGPHLHFEVWAGADVSTRVDPFAGNCNILNNNSWWIAQKPAKETGIVRASVHSTDIVLPACPTTETLNESSMYEMPFQGPGLPAGYAKFYIFIRDEINGTVGTMSILNPDQSVFATWTYTSSVDSKTKVFGWSKKLPTVAGTYTFKATYNGVTCSSTFDMSTAAGVATLANDENIELYPNPSNGIFTIETATNGQLLSFYNVLGAKVYETKITSSKTEISLGSGVYFYQLTSENQATKTGRVVVK
ncbi:MAG: peptidoglycan DD-metalloendopeptidase family protein [Bacteroidetes bacterium]|nr:peptidoglycan DD-metalloendopeptidase family protein [Bacteroidota bacterium]